MRGAFGIEAEGSERGLNIVSIADHRATTATLRALGRLSLLPLVLLGATDLLAPLLLLTPEGLTRRGLRSLLLSLRLPLPAPRVDEGGHGQHTRSA